MKTMGFSGSGVSSSRAFTLSVGLLVLATLCFCASMFMFLRDASHDSKYLQTAGDLRVFAHQISTSSREATEGNASAFSTLSKASERFDNALETIRDGNASLPGAGSMLSGEMKSLGSIWQGVNQNADTIVSNRERILFLHDVAKTLSESIPELQREYEAVIEILLDKEATADQVAIAQKQTLLAERIARNVDKMLEGGTTAQEAADQFNLDASIFGGVLQVFCLGVDQDAEHRFQGEIGTHHAEEQVFGQSKYPARHAVQQSGCQGDDCRCAGCHRDDRLPDDGACRIEAERTFQRTKYDQGHQHGSARGIHQHVGQNYLPPQRPV